mmetsp:Transcript_19479/g.44193  ORF Transcript_19479/g.44193 Transcript_19479/m.44193 type:complete len:471 (-) Transcript_19479:259-1671(-)
MVSPWGSWRSLSLTEAPPNHASEVSLPPQNAGAGSRSHPPIDGSRASKAGMRPKSPKLPPDGLIGLGSRPDLTRSSGPKKYSAKTTAEGRRSVSVERVSGFSTSKGSSAPSVAGLSDHERPDPSLGTRNERCGGPAFFSKASRGSATAMAEGAARGIGLPEARSRTIRPTPRDSRSSASSLPKGCCVTGGAWLVSLASTSNSMTSHSLVGRSTGPPELLLSSLGSSRKLGLASRGWARSRRLSRPVTRSSSERHSSSSASQIPVASAHTSEPSPTGDEALEEACDEGKELAGELPGERLVLKTSLFPALGATRRCGLARPCGSRRTFSRTSGRSRRKDSCAYAPQSGPLATFRNPYRLSWRWKDEYFWWRKCWSRVRDVNSAMSRISNAVPSAFHPTAESDSVSKISNSFRGNTCGAPLRPVRGKLPSGPRVHLVATPSCSKPMASEMGLVGLEEARFERRREIVFICIG